MNDIHTKIIENFRNDYNPIILDIGAYRLEDSIEFAKKFPNGQIYSFEADLRNIEAIKHLIYPQNIYLEHYAVGNIDGEIDFFQSEDIDLAIPWFQSGSIHKPTGHLKEYTVRFNSEPVKVEGVKLDTWYEEALIQKEIELAYVDVNGGEWDFILGAKKVLSNKIRLLYIEQFDKELYEGQKNQDVIKDKLDILGFDFLWQSGHNGFYRNRNL